MRAFVVDAFTGVAFAGNPAGVVLLDASTEVDEHWMQHVAAEFNHAETAFVAPRSHDGFGLRWFTPAVEVDLCGHATLAASHVLHEAGKTGPFVFSTRSGELTTSVDDGVVTMDFPAQPPEGAVDGSGLHAALGLPAHAVAADAAHTNGVDLVVDLADTETVLAVRPDVSAIAALPYRGVIVTAAAPEGSDHDFVSRFFGPAVGVDEDPVTGSAHCALGPMWAERLGRDDLVGAQLSRRGGRVRVGVRGARVLLRGEAVTVLRGTLLA